VSTAPVKLVQITDPHLFGDPAGRLRGVATLAALQATLRAAAGDIAAAEAILATGDLVQDDPAGYALFRASFAALGKPVLCVPGNHDVAAELTRSLQGEPFQVGGYRDFGAWRVVLLDSSVARRAQGRLAEAELAALEQSLATAGGRHVLVALHHHPVPMASQWLDTVGLANADAFFAVIDRHPQVRGVVFGHVHQAFEGVHRGVRILGTPSTCAQFLPGARDFAVDDLPPAYRLLTLFPDGQIATSVAWLASRQVPASVAG
jgi:Icc protein